MKFKTKLILLTSLILLAGMLLTAIIALLGINNLGGLALKEVEKGLVAANQEYFVNYTQTNARRTNQLLTEAISEVQLLAEIGQQLEDNKASLGGVGDAATLKEKDELSFNQAGGWYQNGSDKPTLLSIPPYLIEANGQLKPGTEAAIRQTTLLNLFLPAAKKYGLEKGQVLYFGPPDLAYLRSAPWNDYAGELAKNFPNDYRTRNLWEYTPGLLQSWESRATQPGFKIDAPEQVTLYPPFQAADKNLYMRFLQPIWDKDRKQVRGTVGLDLALGQLIQPISELQIANTGFAFLIQSDGGVILKNEAERTRLGLKAATSNPATTPPKLKDSSVPDLANLPIPTDDKIQFKEVNINGERYYTVLSRLKPLNFVLDRGTGIGQEAWTLGFIVPRQELLASWFATEKTINDGAGRVVWFTLVASLIALLVVIGVVYVVANRVTGSLVALTGAATKIQQKDYSSRVQIKSKDEFGQLGTAFNQMTAEIANYTANLEELVQQRTAQLEQANQEISLLNEQLKSENVRLKAELEVTRRLQQMILPREAELEAISDLEIVGFMEPAEEVGGDYYDVLQQNGRVKIGIGDVTGHGLESGVLMIMVQTAIRTLLANQVLEPSDYFSVVNQTIYDNVQRMSSDKNLTLSLLDYKDGVLSLSGQHEEMIMVRAGGSLEVINTFDLGFPIGLEEDIAPFIAQAELQLNPADVVVLYTDGITEAENLAQAQYGLARLCQVVQANYQKSALAIRDIIIEDVRRHIGTQKVYDDITLLVIKRKSKTS